MKKYDIDLIRYKDEVECHTIGVVPLISVSGKNRIEAIANIAKKLKTIPERINVVTVSVEK